MAESAEMRIRHPRGLYVLFGTEMWERLSYYGMRSILVLYMVAPLAAGGLGFATTKATRIYGLYTGTVWLAPLIGGWIADRFLGAKRTVLLGGIIIASGHYCLAVPMFATFYAGLVLIVLGTGLLKPNISAMVGSLYTAGDTRRDAGFSIFYMGINLGGILAPLICGTLAQAPIVKQWLLQMGLPPETAWHVGFGAAGIGMTFGLLQFVIQRRHLAHVGNTVTQRANTEAIRPAAPLTRDEWKRIWAIAVFFAAAAIFWTIFEQAGSSMTLFADQLTRNALFGWAFPSSWFQSVNPLMIIVLAPCFAALWSRWGAGQPSSPAKFACGLILAGLAFGVLACGASLTGAGPVSPLWLIATYFLHTVGELCLSPVGLSTVTKLAPARMVGLMMGIWFLASCVGNYAGGWMAGFFRPDAAALVHLFGGLSLMAIVAGGVLALLARQVRSLMAGVR